MERQWMVLGTALMVLAAGCDQVRQAVTPQPRRCEVCNGTGSITQSIEAQLPADILRCHDDTTGFLGLGADHDVTVIVRNNGDEPGTFKVRVIGLYPGGGRIEAGAGEVYIAAHADGTQRIRYRPQDGMQKIECIAASPTVIQRKTAICPTCRGKGMVTK